MVGVEEMSTQTNSCAEIEAMLEEAREAEERGETTPLEPLHVFLRRARERLNFTPGQHT